MLFKETKANTSEHQFIWPLLPTAREGNVFTGDCLSTIGFVDTGSLLGLVTAQLVRILLECFLVKCNEQMDFSISRNYYYPKPRLENIVQFFQVIHKFVLFYRKMVFLLSFNYYYTWSIVLVVIQSSRYYGDTVHVDTESAHYSHKVNSLSHPSGCAYRCCHLLVHEYAAASAIEPTG